MYIEFLADETTIGSFWEQWELGTWALKQVGTGNLDINLVGTWEHRILKVGTGNIIFLRLCELGT